jgi:hypothetical protein
MDPATAVTLEKDRAGLILDSALTNVTQVTLIAWHPHAAPDRLKRDTSRHNALVVVHQPALIPRALSLEWLDEVFLDLDWTIPAGTLAPDLPETAVTPAELRQFLLDEATSYSTRDAIWTGIVAKARGPDSSSYQLIALGLALPGLKGFRRHIRVTDSQDLLDVQGDLLCGFLTRLATIDTTKRNIAGRLIDGAIGHAARRYTTHRRRSRPARSPRTAIRSLPGRSRSTAAGTRR